MTSFDEFGFSDQIMQNLASVSYKVPTDVQAKAIPVILQKKDVVIQSQTGSGKTAAFGLPLIHSVMTDVPAVQFLVLVPTRELAAQVRDEIASLSKDTNVKLAAIYGGADMKKQIDKLRKGAQIVIGTPGRILDHLKRRTMSFSVVRAVVLDESDKMLSMGFLPDVQLIFKQLPKRRQMIMSSATFPFSIQQLIHQYMIEPERLMLSSDDVAPKGIDHQFCILQNSDKEPVLLALLEKEEPDLSLIFCNTRSDVKAVHVFLANAGLKVEGLSSDLSQNMREQVLRKLKTGAIQHLVCTDLAARGIDIPELTHVFNYASSGDTETYVHRTGRTGRAGRSGKAISLVSSHDLAGFLSALKMNDIEAREIHPPTEAEIDTARMKRHLRHLESIDYARDVDVREEFTELASQLTKEQGKTLIPWLLEHLFRPQPVVEPPGEEPPPEPQSQPESYAHEGGHRGHHQRRGRDHRDGGRGPGRYQKGRGHGHSGHSGSSGHSGHSGHSRYDHHGPPRVSSKPSHHDHRKSRSFMTVCLGLGRLDGLDVMDIQNILRRQGKARLEDIGEITMKDHESFISIGSGSLDNVLAADGRYFKNFELFIAKTPDSMERAPSGE